MAATVPEEILSEILSHFVYEDKALLKCALISRAWVGPSRRAHFSKKDIVLGNPGPHSFLHRILNAELANDPQSTIVPFIISAAIVGPKADSYHINPQYQSFNLFEQELHASAQPLRLQIGKLAISGLKQFSSSLVVMQTLTSFPNVRELRLSDIQFRSLSEFSQFISPANFPRLRKLSLSHMHLNEREADGSVHAIPGLDILSIGPSVRNIAWLRCLQDQGCQLTRLSLNSPSWSPNSEDQMMVAGLVKIAGLKLEHLVLNYILPHSPNPPVVLDENQNLKSLYVGSFPAIDNSTTALVALHTLIGTIISTTLRDIEMVIQLPLRTDSSDRILQEATQWRSLEQVLLDRRDLRARESVKFTFLFDGDRPSVQTAVTRAFRRVLRRLEQSGRLSVQGKPADLETFHGWAQ